MWIWIDKTIDKSKHLGTQFIIEMLKPEKKNLIFLFYNCMFYLWCLSQFLLIGIFWFLSMIYIVYIIILNKY